MILWLWLTACAPPPSDRDGTGAAALDRLTEKGACGDLVAYAASVERDARLVIVATERPVAQAFEQQSPFSVQIALAQPLGAQVFLEVGEAPLADPCGFAGAVPRSDSDVYRPAEGFVRLTVTPLAAEAEDGALGVVDIGLEEAVLLSDAGVVSVEQLTVSDARVP